jgi:hypothetical protein
MTATYDFDRLLGSVLQSNGPQTLPSGVVDPALTTARTIRQRRPVVAGLDRRAWPTQRLVPSSTTRLAMVGLAVLLVLAALAVGGAVGTHLLDQTHRGPRGPIASVPPTAPSPSSDSVVAPVVQTPPPAPPVDPNGVFSALSYSTFRLGCREPFRLDLTTGASLSIGDCHDLVAPDSSSVGRRGPAGLMVSNQGGSASVPVDAPKDAYPMAWSPDSRWLVWTAAEDPTGRPMVAGIVSADGSRQVRLPAPDAAWETPSWSPDSSRVAIATSAGLLVGKADGSDLRIIGSFPTPLAWAPGGDRFAYVYGGDLWTVNIDGAGPTNLTRFTFGGAGTAAWSPFGGTIAVMQGRTLWFVDLFGGRHGVDLGIDAASGVSQLAWAPAGGSLAVALGGDRSAIDLVSSDGASVVRVEDAASPTWYPSGQYLAFRALDPGAPVGQVVVEGIGIVNADGSGRRTWPIDGNVSVLPMTWIR